MAPVAACRWTQWATQAHAAAQECAAAAERQRLARAAAETQRELQAATAAAEEAIAHAQALSRQLEAMVQALHSPAVETVAPRTPPAHWERLSPREREVLALVAEGRSNKAIATALFVSPNTVKTHVAALLTKLEADTRVQLAALAAGQAPWPDAA
ncbi:MAG: LuxR C-terminal-related transcriptional regulator [Thermomicrobiales bacterium]